MYGKISTFFENIRALSRRLLVIAVLAGICFSSGEGIRLLPFPSSQLGAPAVNGDQIGGKPANSYVRTVRNAPAPSVIAKIKAKDTQNLSGRTVAVSTKLQHVAIRTKRIPDNFANEVLGTASGPISHQTDRGPPV